MKRSVRRFPVIFSVALAALATMSHLPAAFAQSFPVAGRPIRIVVPFPPGGQTDIHARLVAPKLGEAFGVPVAVDNKPGASSVIAAQDVARATADGHTLFYTSLLTHTQNPHLLAKLPYDPFRDFTPITLFVHSGTVLVAHPSLPADNVRELVAYAKANPGKLNYASVSPGSTSHLNAEWLKMLTGIELVHVPYKGSADAIRDLLGGQVQLMFDGATTAVQNFRAGKVKLLGAATEARIAALPELATVAEQGIDGVNISGWIGFFAPGGLPDEALGKLNRELVRIVLSPEVSDAIRKGGNEPVGNSPQEFARIVRDHHERWGRVIRHIGLKLD
jgi:tripartite-type tricarboxylate transporter receptor subunit TctC